MLIEKIKELFRSKAETPSPLAGHEVVYPYWGCSAEEIPTFSFHKDPQIAAILRDRKQKKYLAQHFAEYVDYRLSQDDLSEVEIRDLQREAARLAEICVPDQQPYDPMGRRVFSAVSFNGSWAILMALTREKRAMMAVEKRERRSLERKLRRQRGESAGCTPAHEDEDLHRLHDELVALRRSHEAENSLHITFCKRSGAINRSPKIIPKTGPKPPRKKPPQDV